MTCHEKTPQKKNKKAITCRKDYVSRQKMEFAPHLIPDNPLHHAYMTVQSKYISLCRQHGMLTGRILTLRQKIEERRGREELGHDPAPGVRLYQMATPQYRIQITNDQIPSAIECLELMSARLLEEVKGLGSYLLSLSQEYYFLRQPGKPEKATQTSNKWREVESTKILLQVQDALRAQLEETQAVQSVDRLRVQQLTESNSLLQERVRLLEERVRRQGVSPSTGWFSVWRRILWILVSGARRPHNKATARMEPREKSQRQPKIWKRIRHRLRRERTAT